MPSASPQKRQDEQELVRRARAGDDAAFEALVNIYRRPIFDYCRRMVGDAVAAEDLAQEAFVKFYFALPTFDTSKPPSPFLYRIAHNHCTDWLRKKKIATVPLEWRDEEGGLAEIPLPDVTPAPDELAARAEVQAAVEEALASLPPVYRSALIMRHRDNLSYEEIAEALDLPLGTVKARIHRGREKLQQKLRGFV